MRQNVPGLTSQSVHPTRRWPRRYMGEFMLWVALPSVLLATMCSFENLSIPGRAQRAIDGQEMSHEPIEIIATGRHFQWFFQYPGPDGIS